MEDDKKMTRLARELETRETAERPKSWQPASLLPEPDKEPGYTYRWVRISSLGQADPSNLTGKLREGWEPVKANTQPRFQMMTDPNSRFKDNIEIGGLLLCRIPSEFMEQRKAYYDKASQAQVQAVDNNLMRENDPRMPIFSEKKSSTSFGKGK